jgi:hypothetical protein
MAPSTKLLECLAANEYPLPLPRLAEAAIARFRSSTLELELCFKGQA